MEAIKMEQIEIGEVHDELRKSNVKAEVVQMDLNKGKWEHMSAEVVHEYKNIFIENYFMIPDNKDYIPTAYDVRSQKAINKLWGKYQRLFNMDKQSYMSEVIAAVCTIVIQFKESQNTFDYTQLIVPDSKENKKMHGYIVSVGVKNISALESELMKHCNFDSNRKYDGDVKELPIVSLDYEMPSEDGDSYSMYDGISHESSMFHHREGFVQSEEDSDEWEYQSQYHAPPFTIWFKKWMNANRALRNHKSRNMNQSAELTKKQIEYYDAMSKLFIGELISDKEGYEGTYAEQVRVMEAENARLEKVNKNRVKRGGEPHPLIRIYTQADMNQYNNAIRDKALEAFAKDGGNKTFLQMRHEEEKFILSGAIDLLDDEKLSPSNSDYALSRWIFKNFEEESIQDLLFKMESRDYQNIVFGKRTGKKIDKHTLYEFMDLLEKRIEDINEFEYEKTGFYKRDDEYIEGSREKAMKAKAERERKYNEFIGEQIAEESNYKRKQVLPSGAVVEVDAFDDNFY